MPRKPPLDAAITVLSVAAVWAALVRFAVAHGPSLYDDAYIYLRYARNVFNGCPLAFNCQDGRVEGFTSPFYLLLLCLAHVVSKSWVFTLRVVCASCLAASLASSLWLARHPSFGRGPFGVLLVAAVAVVLGADHYVLLNGVVGLETGLVAVAVTAIAIGALDPDLRGLRVALVVAVLVRPECGVFCLALPVLRETRSLRYWTPLVLAAAVIVLARVGIFHDVVPNTFWAKAGGTLGHARIGLQYIRDSFVDFPLMLLAPLALLMRECRRGVAYLLVASAAWLVFFLYTGGDFEHSRFAFPLVPMLTVLALAGVARLGSQLVGEERKLATLTPVLALLLAVAVGVRARQSHWIADDDRLLRVERWKKVGLFLKRFDPNTTVAATAIGAMGFYSNLRVLDLVGLTNREVGKFGQSAPVLEGRGALGHERNNTAWILSQRPALIMTLAWSHTPFTKNTPVETPGYAEWLLMEAVRRGDAPYRPWTPEVAPGLHWFFFVRNDLVAMNP